MAQIIDLGKFRFNWMGDFDIATEYERNDTVKYGGNVYVYTLNAAATGNLPTDEDFWSLMLEGFNFRGVWSNGTAYELSDLVTYGGKVYLALRDTTGDNPATAAADWEVFSEGIQYEGNWSNLTNYQVGDVVKYGGVVYIATQNSVAAIPSGSSSYWEILVYGLDYKGAYNDSTSYKLNDIVLYGGTTYIALQPGTGNEPTPGSYWAIFTEGIQFEGEWDSETQYQTNDIVNYGGIVYIALQDAISNSPTETAYWAPLIEGISWKGTYSSGTTYNKNDIVASAGSSWIAKQNTTGNAPVVGANWDILAAGTFPSFAGNTGYFLTNDGDEVIWSPNVNVAELDAGIAYMGTDPRQFEIDGALTDPILIMDIAGGEDSFALVAARNTEPTSSMDLQMFNDLGTDEAGWVDLGITGSEFNDPAFTLTGASEGYLFYEAPLTGTSTGNLTIATGANGDTNAIIFAAGGFSTGRTQMAIYPDVNVHVDIDTPSTSPSTGAFTVIGGVGIQGDMNIAGNVAIVGTISFGGSGTTVSTANLAVDAPMIFAGTGNTSDVIDLGIVGEYTIAAVSPATKAVSNKALTSNIATLTTTTAHGYTVGQVVAVTSVDATFNGTFTITGTPTATTFTYTKESTNVVSAAVSPNGSVVTTRDRRYSGVVRDASDGIYKTFSGATTKPTTSVNFSQAGLVYAPVKTGAAEVNSLTVAASGSITATASGVTSAIQNLTLSGSTNVFDSATVSIASTTFTGAPTFSGNPVFSGTPSFTGTPTFTGGVRIQEMIEDVVDVAHSSNVVAIDYSLGNVFWLSNTLSGDAVVNVTNAPTDNGRVFTINLLITQGATGYKPTGASFTVNGSTSAVKWPSAVVPTATSSSGKIDIFTFTIVRRSSAYTVFGSSNANF
jgi:hypothetical protein